jgi:hypothetical protein
MKAPQKTSGSAERRTYVLNTNVLIADPEAPSRFEEHDLVSCCCPRLSEGRPAGCLIKQAEAPTDRGWPRRELVERMWVLQPEQGPAG